MLRVCRRLSSTQSSVRKLQAVLKSLIEKEKLKREEYEDYKSYLQDEGYTLTDEPFTQKVKLAKEQDGKTVELLFWAECDVDPSDNEEFDISQLKLDDEDFVRDHPGYTEVPLQVNITNSEGYGIAAEGFVINGDFEINNIVVTPNIKALEPNWEYGSLSQYRGPQFPTLEADLKESCYDYIWRKALVENRGLSLNIASNIKYKDLYLEWLETVEELTH
eukprot:CAMPEP_0204910634 /NCGR_PEP_ID=MMETSP1397-20131031/9116_1 /ASSEMBLY_ACC=CAM_ASM_000891 /TAXON_ID=49980 /ORGANISM="Climacostomum Climacostomum virens, Strain Stock W-24" /LENGTH=218 /DNA_ID=CAMNT_0052080871 /DNA_START=17 /DNA_END=670 /DNA_ORIENTATION=+